MVCSVILQVSTLLMTYLHDNRERQGTKLVSALLSTLTGVLLRAYLISMLCALKPLSALLTVIVAYVINVILMKYLNREGRSCFVDGYCSLLAPMGYARVLGTASRYLSRDEYSRSF